MKARFLALAALVLGLASCQTEPEGLNVNVGGEVDTFVTVAIPETETRSELTTNSALSVFDNGILEDANTTMRYILEIYYGDIMAERQVQFSDEQKTIAFPVRLVPNRDYNFVVWADVVTKNADEEFSDRDNHYNTKSQTNADGVAYGLDNISLNETWVAMDESRDAFTGYYNTEKEGKKYTGNLGINITLIRPFAKLRIITTDVEDLNKLQIYPHHATVAYTTKHRASFDATDGTYADASLEKTHTYDIVAYGDNVENEQQVLFTDYFFADNDVVKFEMDVFEQNNDSIKNNTFNTDIPVKRNHLTTIAGDILTEGNNVSVIVNPVFANATTNPDEDEHYIKAWDGVAIEEPDYNETTKTYTVKDGAELAWIAQQVNNGIKFEGKTVVLSKNICLGGHEWTPIGGANHFKGTFDGNGKTVGDFKVTEQDGHAGLFGNARATIKNLTVNNVTIVACHYAGGIVGQGYVKMNNCHVDGIDITLSTKNGDWGDKAGGLVGQNCEGSTMYITNSTAKNVKIQGYRDMGGIAGMAHKGNIVTGCSVENIAIFQDLSVDYETTTPTTMAGVVGRVHNDIGEYSNNNESNVEISVIITEGLTQNVESEVYTVTSAEGMQAMVEIAEEDNDAEIVLGGDIDLSELVITRSTVSNWTPIGTEAKPFTGTFDGNGCTIKNLALVENEAKEGKAYIGFFGYAKNATIKNVTFENVYINIPCLDIDHSQGHIGAVAGSLEGTSIIENVTVKGDIQVESTLEANGASRVAVVAGGNTYGNVTMKNVHVIANEGSYLKANNNVGALAGQLQSVAVFENCSSNINVTGYKFFAGGLIGLTAGNSTFTNCHTTGDVTILAGRAGRANDHYRVGGIAGGWADNTKTPCVLTNCSYTGNISGTNADGSVANPLDYAGYVGRGYTLTNMAGSTVIIDGIKWVQVRNDVFGKYYYTGAIVDIAGVKAIVFESGDGFKAVSVEEMNLNGKNWSDAMTWATSLGQGWDLASIYELDDIWNVRSILNNALVADNADNALFCENEYYTAGKYALYLSSTDAVGNDPQGEAYFSNRVHVKYFNLNGYWDYNYSTFATISKYAPLKENYFARAVYAMGEYAIGDIVKVGSEKAIVYSITEEGVKAVSVKQGGEMTWDESMAWAKGLGAGWNLASLEDMQSIYNVRFALNRALAADDASNVLFEEDKKEEDGTDAAYWTSTLVEGTSTTTKAKYVCFSDELKVIQSFAMFPVEYSRAVYTIK